MSGAAEGVGGIGGLRGPREVGERAAPSVDMAERESELDRARRADDAPLVRCGRCKRWLVVWILLRSFTTDLISAE